MSTPVFLLQLDRQHYGAGDRPKVGYRTRKAAKLARRHPGLNVYRCPVCTRFHLGNPHR